MKRKRKRQKDQIKRKLRKKAMLHRLHAPSCNRNGLRRPSLESAMYICDLSLDSVKIAMPYRVEYHNTPCKKTLHASMETDGVIHDYLPPPLLNGRPATCCVRERSDIRFFFFFFFLSFFLLFFFSSFILFCFPSLLLPIFSLLSSLIISLLFFRFSALYLASATYQDWQLSLLKQVSCILTHFDAVASKVLVVRGVINSAALITYMHCVYSRADAATRPLTVTSERCLTLQNPRQKLKSKSRIQVC